MLVCFFMTSLISEIQCRNIFEITTQNFFPTFIFFSIFSMRKAGFPLCPCVLDDRVSDLNPLSHTLAHSSAHSAAVTDGLLPSLMDPDGHEQSKGKYS